MPCGQCQRTQLSTDRTALALLLGGGILALILLAKRR